ncbi:MAG: trypsin-like peptidase domain-containing protein [Leptospiraceae bacterium]|nr:trypsin-like peptidase domain-containing protein [Leptospiraceae bacterium]
MTIKFFFILIILFLNYCKPNEILVEELNSESLLYSAHIQNQFVQIYERSVDGTVSIFAGNEKEKNFLGSGFFITPEAHFLTAQHVTLGREKLFFRIGTHEEYYEAKLLNESKELDLSLLKPNFDSSKEKPKFQYFTLQPNTFPKTGTIYLSISSPFGLAGTYNQGVLANELRNGVYKSSPSSGYIQLNNPVYNGASGGVVLNLNGEAIGMIRFSVGYMGAESFQNTYGFAIPANNLYNFANNQDDIITLKKKINRGIIEIPIMTPYLMKKLNLPGPLGCLVSYVEEGSPAEKAGVKRYDFIIQVDDKIVRDSVEFYVTMKSLMKNKEVKLRVLREGQEKTIIISQYE